ncbi:bifunctional pantoate--beta-alanine ligase/(d)CMP kinase [Trichocoleus sp. Lan]|nr:bifunctional pantoate--beta-alanine ligase/(d)CMP kinase [Coleofasciculus sp. FACHB-SPT9]
MVRLFTTTAGLHCYLDLYRHPLKIGFVPTMGALHAGHLSLIQHARRDNDRVIVSIFVNPLQFGPTEDFQQYPRRLEQDWQLCEQAGVDAIFAPAPEEMYGMRNVERTLAPVPDSQLPIPNDLTQVVPPESMTSLLCGRSRPGHFQGVATVVAKLLNLVQPTHAYFGEKDAQQLAIIRRLVADLNLPVEIIGCPIVREASGLALSSRNQYLSAEQKEQASVLYRGLQQAQKKFKSGDRDRIVLIEAAQKEFALVPEVQIEYIELVHPTTLMRLEKVDEAGLLSIAARLGTTRLIDNVTLRDRQPILAIDGPAGAGKSTVARTVAQSLGLLYLDTGAMYRALTWLVLESGTSVKDEPAIAELASGSQIQLSTSDDLQTPVRVWIHDREVTQAIRSREVTAQVSAIAAQPYVRRELVKQQQRWGVKGGVVAEGRDIGTHVFPDAELKIFLTASAHARAQRRQQDLKNQAQPEVSLEQLERDIQERDTRDSTRALAPLRKAADAIEIQTDGLSIAEVTAQIVSLYHQRLSVPV